MFSFIPDVALIYCKVKSSNTSGLEAHTVIIYRLLMKGIFDANVLRPFDKKLVFELVTCINPHDIMVVLVWF